MKAGDPFDPLPLPASEVVQRLRGRAHVARWGMRRRIAEVNAAWHFRHWTTGPRARVLGWPLVTNPDVEAGSEFLVWSHYRRTHIGGTGPIRFGDRVFLNAGAVVLSYVSIEIGDDVALASEVFVTDSDNHPIGGAPVREAPIRIEDGAWVATRAIVLPGVTIGSRSVVAAGSVVTRDVPPDTLAAGVPARAVRTIEYPPGKRTAWKET